MSRADSHRLNAIFSAKMMAKHHNRGCIVANASDQFSLYKMLEVFAKEAAHDCPDLRDHVAVYVLACQLTDVFRNVKHRRMSTADAKGKALHLIKAWQDAHKALYGEQHFRPKFNWVFAVALGLDRSPWLFDMFIVERQHQRVKCHAEAVRNTPTFGASVLMRVLDSQLTSLQDFRPVKCG